MPSPQEIVDYLVDHPDFFNDRPDILASLNVPHPQNGRAISLVERQMMAMRDKYKALELRLAELVRNGRENDAIAERMQHWTRELLRTEDSSRLPGAILQGVREAFTIPQAGLRLWNVPGAPDRLDPLFTADVDADLITLAGSMQLPYCGPNTGFGVVRLLRSSDADAPDTRSLAMIPLRIGVSPEAFGLLLLGSPDAGRFSADMGTAFLERIGELSSAALSRLYAPVLV